MPPENLSNSQPPSNTPDTPVAADPASAPIDASWQSPLKQIRTYQGDIAEAIKGEHQSLVSIRAAEKARQDLLKKDAPETAPAPDPEKQAAERRRVHSILFFIGGLIFVGAAGVGGYYAYTTYKHKTFVPTTAAAPENRFLSVSSTQDADASVLSRDALVSLLNTERGKPLAVGSIEHIELRKGAGASAPLTTATEFLLLTGATPPGNFVRALDPLFMLGVVGLPAEPAPALDAASTTPTLTPEKNAVAILFKLDSFDNAYAGMLDWENHLASDLLPFFHPADVIATVPENASWTDVTIKNKDARKLVDASGKTELIYSFYNQNLLIITASEEALGSVLTALDTQALAR